MGRDLIVWVSVTLFLVHEFEEIICIRPWIVRHRNDPRARRQVFWSFRDTNTSVIAAMIFEEYLLFVATAFAAVAFDQLVVFAGLMIPYTLHLISHVLEAARLRMRTPSVVTSFLTLPWCIYAIVALITQISRPILVAIWTGIFTIVIAANFALIYSLRARLSRRLSDALLPRGE